MILLRASEPERVATCPQSFGGLPVVGSAAASQSVAARNRMLYARVAIDDYWEKLSQGGHTDQCGWLR